MYLCMTKITNIKNNKSEIVHGRALSQKRATTCVDMKYYKTGSEITSWVARADIPHKCNVKFCNLYRNYLKNNFWEIGVKGLLYYECIKVLKKRIPDDIVLYIVEKCFSKQNNLVYPKSGISI